MERRMVLYRGSLKSCNYRCGYCPFSKHRGSEREYAADREQWFRFCGSLSERAEKQKIRALMVVPYGEALIHPWYWEGLGAVTGSDAIQAAGAQTNLSFSMGRSLEIFENAGGIRGKLRLWATFHPEMTTPEEFVGRCIALRKEGVLLSAGAVGVPENLPLLRTLRSMLPEDIYLWINKMDGLRRPYTEEEIRQFQSVDPYFYRELRPVRRDESLCGERLFIEGDGKVRRCNIGPILGKNWYDARSWEEISQETGANEAALCRRRFCSCYLAYGGRDDVMNRVLFGPYPLFRIPGKPRAVFLDIDGTLIPGAETAGGKEKSGKKDGKEWYPEEGHLGQRSQMKGEIPRHTREDLQALAQKGCTRLFFATTLPYEEAKKRCGQVWPFFSGGVFAAGAHVVLRTPEGKREHVFCLEEEEKNRCLDILEQETKNGAVRMVIYRRRKGAACRKGESLLREGASVSSEEDSRGDVYKITLIRPRHRKWQEEEVRALTARLCPEETGEGKKIRCFAENHCLQIVSAEATKAAGVRMLCGWMGVSLKDVAAEGDSEEDREMMALPYAGREL